MYEVAEVFISSDAHNWLSLQSVSLAWGALSSPLKAWLVKFCSVFHVLECRVLICPALGCL